MRTLLKIRPIIFPGVKGWTWECAVCMHMPERVIYPTWDAAKNAGLEHVVEYESRYRR